MRTDGKLAPDYWQQRIESVAADLSLSESSADSLAARSDAEALRRYIGWMQQKSDAYALLAAGA